MDDQMNEERQDRDRPYWEANIELGGNHSWMWGLALIFVGVIFLLSNLTGFELHNWWALFILFPALGNFSSALNQYRAAGALDRRSRSHLFWGIFFVLLSGAFLLDYSFSLLWPIFLILGGLGILFGAF